MAITLANSVIISNVTGSSVTSIASTAKNMTTGNLIVVGVRNRSNNPSVSDTAGNTYIKINNQSSMGATDFFTMFYCANCTGNANNVVTATFPSEAYVAIQVQEWTVVDTLDQTTYRNQTTSVSTVTSPTFTTTSANEVVIGMSSTWTISQNFAAVTGYTLAASDPGGMTAHTYKVVSSILTNDTCGITDSSGAVNWELSVATFKIGGEEPTTAVKDVIGTGIIPFAR